MVYNNEDTLLSYKDLMSAEEYNELVEKKYTYPYRYFCFEMHVLNGEKNLSFIERFFSV